ncbi:MAG: MMPL family transporter, partial [Geminicoccaceae bacterium]
MRVRGRIPSWAEIGEIVRRRPWHVLGIGVVLLALPLLALPSLQLSSDMLSQLPENAPSAQGFNAIGRHMPLGEMAPVMLVVDDKKTSHFSPGAFNALGDLSKSLLKLDGVSSVRSAAMPTAGEQPSQATTGQNQDLQNFPQKLGQAADGAGKIEDGVAKLRDGLAQMDSRLPELTHGLGQGAEGVKKMDDGVGQLRQGVAAARQGLGQLRSGLAQGRTGVVRLRDEVAAPTDKALRDAWSSLQAFTVGKTDPKYPDALTAVGQAYGRVTGQNPLTGQPAQPGYNGLTASLSELADGVGKAVTGVGQLDDGLGRLDSGLGQLHDGLTRLLTGLQQAQPGVAQLQDGVKQMLTGVQSQLLPGVDQLHTGLLQGAQKASALDVSGLTTTAGPFVLTPGILNAVPELKQQLGVFVTPDEHRSRIFVGLKASPFTNEAIAAAKQIEDTAKLSLKKTPLAHARVYATGTSAFFHDVQHASNGDLPVITLAVLAGVFLVLALLLRSVVAPIYLVGTVLLSLASALGLTVFVFQVLLHQSGLAWWLPPFVFVLLVALGADYNIFFMGRVREAVRGQPTDKAVVEGLRGTGRVI